MSFKYFTLPWNNPLKYLAIGQDEDQPKTHLCYSKDFQCIAVLEMSHLPENKITTISTPQLSWSAEIPKIEPNKNFIQEYIKEFSTPEKPMYRLPKNNSGFVLLRKIYSYYNGRYSESLCFLDRGGGMLVLTDHSTDFGEPRLPQLEHIYDISGMLPEKNSDHVHLWDCKLHIENHL